MSRRETTYVVESCPHCGRGHRLRIELLVITPADRVTNGTVVQVCMVASHCSVDARPFSISLPVQLGQGERLVRARCLSVQAEV